MQRNRAIYFLFRIAAFVIGLGFPLAAVVLALFISGVEPDRPVSLKFVSFMGLNGVGLGLGYLAYAFTPHRILRESNNARVIIIALLLIPFVVTLIFSFTAGDWLVKSIWFGITIFTALIAGVIARSRVGMAVSQEPR